MRDVGWLISTTVIQLNSTSVGFERTVQRRQLVLPSSPNVTAYWMWKEMGMNFVPYDMQSSVEIELTYVQGYTSVDLSKCSTRLPYTIDFVRMEQTRHAYNTRRPVKRCILPPGTSLQSLLALTTGLTGTTGLASGGVGMTTHGTGLAGTGYHVPPTGYGYVPLVNPTPGVIKSKSAAPLSSMPSGHIVKSGMAGLTSPHVGPATKILATLGVTGPLPSSTSTSTLAASAPPPSHHAPPPSHHAPPPSRHAPPPSHHAPPSGTTSLSPATALPSAHPSSFSTSHAVSRSTAASPNKKRKGNKRASNSRVPSHSTSSAGGSGTCPSSSVKVKSEKTKKAGKEGRSGRGKHKGAMMSFNDETSKYARMKKKKPKSTEDGVSGF